MKKQTVAYTKIVVTELTRKGMQKEIEAENEKVVEGITGRVRKKAKMDEGISNVIQDSSKTVVTD